MARERKDIVDAIGLYQARIAQAELAMARARALQEELAKVVRRRFVELLVERYPSPLAPGVAIQGATQLVASGLQLARAPLEWYQSLPGTQRSLLRWLLPAGLVPAVLVAWAVRRLLLARYAARRLARPGIKPSLAEAAIRAVGLGAVPAAMLAISSLVLVAATDIENAGLARDVLLAFVLVLLFLVVVDSVCRALLAAQDEGPPLTPLQPESASRLRHRMMFLAAVFAIGFGLRQAAETLPSTPEQQAMLGLLFCSLAAMAIVLAMHGAAWRTRAGLCGL